MGGGMQIPVVDIDGDGDLDVICAGKSGLFLAENLTKGATAVAMSVGVSAVRRSAPGFGGRQSAVKAQARSQRSSGRDHTRRSLNRRPEVRTPDAFLLIFGF